jgi:glutathione S-transferase
LLGSRKTPFIAGEQVTIADLLLYFELSNVMLYKKEWSQYKNMDAWFKKMYGIPELKQITHAWFPTIK